MQPFISRKYHQRDQPTLHASASISYISHLAQKLWKIINSPIISFGPKQLENT